MSDGIDPVTMILIDFAGDVVPVGQGHILVRFSYDDRDAVKIASQVLGMTQAEFSRTALVKAAHKVISENARR